MPQRASTDIGEKLGHSGEEQREFLRVRNLVRRIMVSPSAAAILNNFDVLLKPEKEERVNGNVVVVQNDDIVVKESRNVDVIVELVDCGVMMVKDAGGGL